MVLQKHPDIQFRFIGRDSFINPFGKTGKQILQQELKKHISSLEFLEHVPMEMIPDLLADSSFCVFPSLWENFPTVCLEAMSAARAVVGSKNGGMEDLLQNPIAGILTDPLNASEVATAICYLLENPKIKEEMGVQGRQNILQKYNALTLGYQYEQMLNIL